MESISQPRPVWSEPRPSLQVLALSIAPSVTFLGAAFVRLQYVRQDARKLRSGSLGAAKLVSLLAHLALQCALAGLWATAHNENYLLRLVATVLSVFVAVVAIPLSRLEHGRAKRPSTTLISYFSLTPLFDLLWLRTAMNHHLGQPYTAIVVASIGVKAVIAILESIGKTRYAHFKDAQGSPEDWAGLWSRIACAWLLPFLVTGYRTKLSIDDIAPIAEELKTEPLDREAQASLQSWDGKRSLIWKLLWLLRWPLLYPTLPHALSIVFIFGKPLLMKQVLQYLGRDEFQPASTDTETFLIIATAIMYTGLSASFSLFNSMGDRLMTKTSTILVSAIYRKVLLLPATESDQTAITLMETDVRRFCIGIVLSHDFCSKLIQVGVGIWLLYRELGIAAIAPFATAAACFLASMAANRFALRVQDHWMQAIQRRIKAISLLLSSIKGIRMAGLSEISREAITAIRAGELDAAGGFRLGISIIVLIAFTPEFITPVACFAIYMLNSENGSGFNITRAFVSLALMMILAEPLSRLLQMSPAFIEAHNCLRRIEKFLLLPTHKETRCFIESDLQGRGTSTVTQSNETQRGNSTKGTPMREMGNNLVIVENGEFYWSFDSPVLRNVNIEIPKSAITLAIGSVASGKSTFCKALLGEVPQSGGNIYLDASLARIGYCDQTPYLTNGTVQQNIIGHETLHKSWYNTVIDALMLMDDFETFPEGDQTLIGSNGIALSSGQRQRVALARAVYTQNEFLVLDDVLSAMDTITKKRIFTKLFGPDGLLRRSKTTVVVVGHDQQLLQIADHIILFKKGEPPESRAPQAELDAKFLEEDGERTSSVDTTKTDGREDEGKTKATTPDSETATSSSGWSVYKYYCATVGWFNVFLLILYGTLYATFTSFPTLWLSWWTSDIGHSDSYYLSVYAILQASGLIFSFLFIRHCLVATVASSGRILHRRLVSAVMQATMPFLSKTDSGVLLNRFSQDFNYIDDELPRAVMNVIMAPLVGAGHLILVATPSGWMSLSYPILFAILYWLSKFYIRTSQQLRPMCLEYKSPLYAHFLDTTRGLATIRAFGWTQASIEVQQQLLDTSNRPSYALEMSQCFLGLSQSVISLGMAVFLTTVAFKSGANQGLTAVALVNLNQFTTCIGGIFWSWTSLETSITAVSRVKDFCEKTPREGTEGALVDKYTEDNWPSAGGIDCRDLVASYGADAEEMALKGVNLTIQPGERIGICGRSGSGKSTFLTSLLRLVDIRSGGISIDGIDIRSVQLSSLRSRINAIPQDPFFLPGTFRSNISPYETSSDGAIEEALRRVHLWDKVEQSGGLDGELKPDEMSQGEKQLFSMARAILRRDCKIVMLDEVSSSLDFETEKLIVQVLKEAFQGCTIIAIAHRLETIIDFDRVAVFADGDVIECDAPDKLLEKPNSAFAKLRAAGQS